MGASGTDRVDDLPALRALELRERGGETSVLLSCELVSHQTTLARLLALLRPLCPVAFGGTSGKTASRIPARGSSEESFSRDWDPGTKARWRAVRLAALPAEVLPRTTSPGGTSPARKVVVVAREDDDETMLNHALIQGRRRYRR